MINSPNNAITPPNNFNNLPNHAMTQPNNAVNSANNAINFLFFCPPPECSWALLAISHWMSRNKKRLPVVVPVPRVMTQEVVVNVPVPQVQVVEKIVEVPQVQTVEKIVQIPQLQVTCLSTPLQQEKIRPGAAQLGHKSDLGGWVGVSASPFSTIIKKQERPKAPQRHCY